MTEKAGQIARQISEGKVVCPETHERLELRDDVVARKSGGREYPLLDGVPILLVDREQAEKYARSSDRMNREYSGGSKPPGPLRRLRSKVREAISGGPGEIRTDASRQALKAIFDESREEGVYLSVGGGPVRQDPRLINLNIGPFANVEIVADAHRLPYAEESVDGVLCEAVLEHLMTPEQAVAEIFRVLKPGGRCLVITPLLQGFHGYPSHFQNYTLAGHELLMTRAGFGVLTSGTCGGPVTAWVDLTGRLIREFLPKPLAWAGDQVWSVAGGLLKPLDKRLSEREHSHYLAYSTFVLCEKK